MRSLLLVVGLLCSCAKMGPPQGGPVDKIAPKILTHNPALDALEVPLTSVVEITFSEAMDQGRTQEAIFISPSGPLDFDWRGRSLRLKMALRPQRTYIATVGTGARDVRGNALEQSFSLAFSTGNRLDQGVLSGRVYKGHAPERGAHVWAYDLAHFSGKIGVELPAYQTQSGVDGQYEFQNLAPGAYRLLAFVDSDRDVEPSAGEWVALPAADVVVGDSLVEASDLLLAQRQVADVVLERIQSIHDHALLLLFSAAVDPLQLALRISGLAVGPFYVGEDLHKVYAQTAQQEVGREYVVENIELDARKLKWQESVRGGGRPDRKGPVFLGLAVERVLPNEPVELLFSEAMETSSDAKVTLDSTQALEGRWQWVSPVRVAFTPNQPWKTGQRILQLRGEAWRDRAQNAITDSVLTVAFEVATPTASLYGRVVGAKGGVEVHAFDQKALRHYAVQSESDGRFAFVGLLPGDYTLWTFFDENGDGAWNAGTLKPFVRPEAYVRYADLISLSAGQKVEDLKLEFR